MNIIMVIVVILAIAILIIFFAYCYFQYRDREKIRSPYDNEQHAVGFGSFNKNTNNDNKSLLVSESIKNQSLKIVQPSGLINSRETCYMNSMVQALASSKVLIKQYKEIVKNVQNNGESNKITVFTDLLQSINRPKNQDQCLQNNTKNLKKIMNLVEWNRSSQEDSFQLLSYVINNIQKDIKNYLENEKITMPPKFKLLHTFTESSGYNKVQDHLALALPLCGDFRNVPGVELNTLMDAFFQPSPIDDGKYSTQMFFFERVPDILILHIQANEWDDIQGTYIKPKYYIRYKDKMEYEFNIHLKKDGSKMMKVKEEYKLTAVVHHMGTISGGHYITYRTHEGVWYLTNDEQVEEVSFNFDKVPYLMIYEKAK